MFKQLTPIRIEWPGGHAPALMNDLLEARAWAPCGPTQPKTIGFVPPREAGGPLVETVGNNLILAVQVETRSVPAAAVKKALAERLDAIEEETGRRPRGRRAKEVKEEVVQALMPHAFPKTSRVPVWLGPGNGIFAVGDASSKKVDEIITLLVEALGCKIGLLTTSASPASAMTNWLVSEPPAHFNVDRECELKQPDGEKATVRYTRHSLDVNQVVGHIEQGKLPTRLAMTFNGRVSFVLTEALTLKKIEILDSALEAAAADEKADAFDADVALATGELGLLLDSLIDALGGELKEQEQ